MRHLALLSIAIVALPLMARGEGAQPLLSFRVTIGDDGVTLAADSAPKDQGHAAEGEFRIQCREMEVASRGSGETVFEFRGDVKVEGCRGGEFEAQAEQLTIGAIGKTLRFRSATVWQKSGATRTSEAFTANHITWRLTGEMTTDAPGPYSNPSPPPAFRSVPPFGGNLSVPPRPLVSDAEVALEFAWPESLDSEETKPLFDPEGVSRRLPGSWRPPLIAP
jgi:hypothetical protein